MSSTENQQIEFEDFILPFGGTLDGDNRWVKLARLIPWNTFEELYREHFSQNGPGPRFKPLRMGLGALIIKEKLKVSDREAVEQIQENPYLQYFLGMAKFEKQAPFDASMYVHFRKRFGSEVLADINERIVACTTKPSRTDKPSKDEEKPDDDDDDDDDEPSAAPKQDQSAPPNGGKLLIDATCAPADIAFPTDLGLLDKAREKTEAIIDILYKEAPTGSRKPRTYRQKARKDYLTIARRKRPAAKAIRKGVRRQLSYVGRNLKSIDALAAANGGYRLLSRSQYKDMLVVSEVFRQQSIMFETRSRSISDRIVSISQPHVRPIVRGKAKAKTEFGAKLSASLVDGYTFVDRISFDAYNEGSDLPAQVEAYAIRFGQYPGKVLADKIYRTRENRRYCAQLGIDLCGPPLGRPRKPSAGNGEALKESKRQRRQDEVDRIPIEGKFGQAKRRFGLGLIQSKLASTSLASISICFIVLNLEKWLQSLFVLVLSLLQPLFLGLLERPKCLGMLRIAA